MDHKLAKRIVMVSGGFDPLHGGHINLLESAKKLGDVLVVGLNSDDWLFRKKGKPFMDFWQRLDIMANLKMVDHVVPFDDDDDTATQFILDCKKNYGKDCIYIFANGGDRNCSNVPERVEGVIQQTGVGGDNKANSSSHICRTQRDWGYFDELLKYPDAKVKLLNIEPNDKISYQRHFERGEFWFILEGKALVKHAIGHESNYENRTLTKHDYFSIMPYHWHQVKNIGDEPLKILEIQYGSYLEEDDIEREEIL